MEPDIPVLPVFLVVRWKMSSGRLTSDQLQRGEIIILKTIKTVMRMMGMWGWR